MKHSRNDYATIVDLSGSIPEHEPVFILRGQDVLCIPTLSFYHDALERNEVPEKSMMQETIQDFIRVVRTWQNSSLGKVKTPDLKTNDETAQKLIKHNEKLNLSQNVGYMQKMEEEVISLRKNIGLKNERIDSLEKSNDQLEEVITLLKEELEGLKNSSK